MATGSVSFRNGKTARNGLCVASMTNCQSNPDGSLHDRELQWLLRRAKGGYGIVISCGMHVQPNGKGWEGEWGCFDDGQTDGFRRAAMALHAEGSLFFVQIFHAGMRADDKLIDGPTRSAVDYVYRHRRGSRQVKGLSETEIEQLIDDFVAAARRLEAAGVDGVEIHGAHGYILMQFLCASLNVRTDKWGGGFDNRARLLREVTRRIRAAVSPGFVVGVRLSPEPSGDFGSRDKTGWNVDTDDVMQLAQWLCEDGADFISLSLVEGKAHTRVARKHAERSESKPLVQVFREACPKDVVVMACGGMRSGADIRALSQLGAEVAVLGQTAISTPDFPKLLERDPEYEVTTLPPYSKDFLASVDVTEPFVKLLTNMGMVQTQSRL